MNISLITDETDSGLVGLGTYALNITQQILAQDKKNNYTLLHRKKEKLDIYKNAREIIVPQPAFPLSMYRNFVGVPNRLKKEKFDLVHHLSSVGPFVLGKPGKKNVQTILDIIPLVRPETYEWQVRLAFKYLLPRVVKNVDHIIAGSETSRKDIVRYFKIPKEKVTVTYLAPHESFKEVDKKKANDFVKKKYGVSDYILYVGSLEAKKNLPVLIEAYAQARSNGVREKLVLAGRRGFGYNAIEKAIRKHNLSEHVVELGSIPNAYVAQDLVMLYNAAKVFAFPSIYEGFGMPAIEAMKCGTPVVTSSGGSLPEVVGKAGVVCKVEDSKSIGNAIATFAKSNSEASKFRKRGLIQAEKFSWKDSAKKTISVYKSL